MDFVGTGKRLTPDGLRHAADVAGVGLAEIAVILIVETDGSGFDRRNRPDILFEPHIFYRQLKGSRAKRNLAVKRGLAYAKWRTKPYPRTSDGNYARLEAACQIDETAALASCSWGLGQVMGSEYKLSDCASPQEIVEESKKGEDEQLVLMAKFIRNKNITKYLRAHNWARTAYLYNGSGYKRNKYDIKMARAYPRFEGRSAEDIVAILGGDSPPKSDILQMGARGEKVKALQMLLNANNYRVGHEDGKYGRLTRDALMAFQADAGIPTSGRVDPRTEKALETIKPREQSIEREIATIDDVREHSRTIQAADMSSKIIGGGTILGGVAKGLDSTLSPIANSAATIGDLGTKAEGIIDTAKVVASPLKMLSGFIVDNMWIFMVVIAIAALFFMYKVKLFRTQDENEGRNL